jgi:Zn-dependent protease
MFFRTGSLRLFRLLGIDVFIHWSWALGPIYFLQGRGGAGDQSTLFYLLVYLGLFAIVLMHEFGHALACRSVGGVSKQIVLTPLGGIAFAQAPPRAGATLWTIAAGPLVNAVLLPVLFGAMFLYANAGNNVQVYLYLRYLAYINLMLLVFNMLPIYPLDGGQILQSLLWFIVGRGRSMMIAAGIGIAGCLALGGLAIWERSFYSGFLALFLISMAFRGFKRGQAIWAIEKIPHHPDTACPSCGFPAPAGDFWQCSRCGHGFDVFASRGSCPACAAPVMAPGCPHCQTHSPFNTWYRAGRSPTAPGPAGSQTATPVAPPIPTIPPPNY